MALYNTENSHVCPIPHLPSPFGNHFFNICLSFQRLFLQLHKFSFFSLSYTQDSTAYMRFQASLFSLTCGLGRRCRIRMWRFCPSLFMSCVIPRVCEPCFTQPGLSGWTQAIFKSFLFLTASHERASTCVILHSHTPLYMEAE